jgi:hypothetical protein
LKYPLNNEKYNKVKQAETEALLPEIYEARTVIDSVHVDKHAIEVFKELKNVVDKYHLEDPKKCLTTCLEYNYDDKRITAKSQTIHTFCLGLIPGTEYIIDIPISIYY